MVYSARRFVVCLILCHFVLVFFSPFSIAITSLGEVRANLRAFRMFDRFVLVWICRLILPLDVWEGLRFVIVALPGLFSYLFSVYMFSPFVIIEANPEFWNFIRGTFVSTVSRNKLDRPGNIEISALPVTFLNFTFSCYRFGWTVASVREIIWIALSVSGRSYWSYCHWLSTPIRTVWTVWIMTRVVVSDQGRGDNCWRTSWFPSGKK